MIHQSTWYKATLGGIAGFVLAMNLAGCGDISSTTSAARSSANAMATHIDSAASGGTQNAAEQLGTVGDSEEGSGESGLPRRVRLGGCRRRQIGRAHV